VRIAGNLKFDVPPPPADAAKLAEFNGAIGARPAWAAVSTHPGEEDLVLDAHVDMAAQTPSLLTIIAPRRWERGVEIVEAARARGLTAALRSQESEPRRDVDVYIVDSVGELGLIFRSVGVVLMGKSLLPGGGGQNPIEPAKLGCAILHGPYVENFTEAYGELAAAKAAARVLDAASLARAAQYLLAEPARMRKMGRAAAETVERLGGASRGIMTAVEPYLAQAWPSNERCARRCFLRCARPPSGVKTARRGLPSPLGALMAASHGARARGAARQFTDDCRAD
jgi:3-deoxy-D-manno-octulosonic-acid transferase